MKTSLKDMPLPGPSYFQCVKMIGDACDVRHFDKVTIFRIRIVNERGAEQKFTCKTFHRTILAGLKEGDKIEIEGHLKHNKYTDKAGVEKWALDIVAEDARILRDPNEAPAAAHLRGNNTSDAEPLEDDLPF